MKGFMLAVLVGFIITLAAIVINGWAGNECESLYDNYSHTTNDNTRQALFDEGIDNGCFHYN